MLAGATTFDVGPKIKKMKYAIPIIASIIALCPAFGAEIPPELERLNAQRARQISEIDKIYMGQLELLKIKFTKAGDLDAANQVAAILKKMAPVEEADRETHWEWGSGGQLVLRQDGVATHTVWTKNGKWRREADGTIRLESSSGRVFIIRIDGNVGQVIDPGGGKGTTIKRKDKNT